MNFKPKAERKIISNKPHSLPREGSLCLSHMKCNVDRMKIERMTGRWRGSSTNLRLALLKMYQGQMEDRPWISLEWRWTLKGRSCLSGLDTTGCAFTHIRKHERENCLSIHSLRGKICQRELEMKKRWGKERQGVPEWDCVCVCVFVWMWVWWHSKEVNWRLWRDDMIQRDH